MHMTTHGDYNLKIFFYDLVRYNDIHTGSWGLQVETFIKIRHDITHTHIDSWGLYLQFSLQTRHKLYFYRVLGSNTCKLFMSRHNIILFQPTQGAIHTLSR